MITHDDVGRTVWANDSRGQLVRVTSIPNGTDKPYLSAVVRFPSGSEQAFPAHRVVLRGMEP